MQINCSKWMDLNNENLKTFFGTEATEIGLYNAYSNTEVIIKSIAENTFEDYKQVTILDIVGHKFTIIQKDLLKFNVKIQRLRLNDNMIKAIDPKALHTLLDLRELHLHDNRLEELSEHLFQRNHLMESLVLRNNQIKTLPQKIFTPIIRMISLDVSHNQIDYMDFEKNIRLIVIYFQYNNLTEITPITQEFYQLNTVKLSFNKFNCTYMKSYMKNLLEKKILLFDEQVYTINYIPERDPLLLKDSSAYCVGQKMYNAQKIRQQMRRAKEKLSNFESDLNEFEIYAFNQN